MGAVLVTEGRNGIESEQDWKIDFTIRQGLIPPSTTPVTKLFPDRISTVVGKFLIPCKHPGSPSEVRTLQTLCGGWYRSSSLGTAVFSL